MTTTRIYRSTDSGAPVLTGAVSALINVLDKCLVEGYGDKVPAGWSKPFTGTNKAAFRNSVAAGGTGMYLRVDDNGSGTGGAREALLRAYSAMTDVDTGSDETPSVAQVAGSIVWRKSNTTDSTARPWVLIADELTVYLCVSTGTNTYGDGFYGAGDFASEVAGDAWRIMIFGRHTQAGANLLGSAPSSGCLIRSVTFATPFAASYWLARGHAGGAGAVAAATPMPATASGGFTEAIGGANLSVASPSPGGGQEYFVPALIACENTIRGTLRGVFMPISSLAGVAMGTDRIAPPGRPEGSVLTVVRHNTGTEDTHATSGNSDGHAAVESALDW